MLCHKSIEMIINRYLKMVEVQKVVAFARGRVSKFQYFLKKKGTGLGDGEGEGEKSNVLKV